MRKGTHWLEIVAAGGIQGKLDIDVFKYNITALAV